MSRCEIIVRMARRAGSVMGALLACCDIASALNPSLDINQYAHTAWTVRDGLFKGVVSSIAQTSDGYLWLGTEFGLLRFDGVRSVPWQPPAGEHLPGNDIQGLLAARDGRLWIGSNHGLSSWKDGKLTHYPELAGQIVSTLLEDREGTVWAGGSATPTGRLCAIRSGSTQCYGEDGSLGQRNPLLIRGQRGQSLGGSGKRAVAMEAGASETLSDARSGARNPRPDRRRQRRTPDRHARRNQTASSTGKPRRIRFQALGRQVSPNRLLRDRNGGLWIGTNGPGALACAPGKDGSVCAV